MLLNFCVFKCIVIYLVDVQVKTNVFNVSLHHVKFHLGKNLIFLFRSILLVLTHLKYSLSYLISTSDSQSGFQVTYIKHLFYCGTLTLQRQ
jgi:hypothetical protein